MQYIACHKNGSNIRSQVTLRDFTCLKRVPEVLSGGRRYSNRAGFYLTSQMLHAKIPLS